MPDRFCNRCRTLIPANDWVQHQERHRHPLGHWSSYRDRNAQHRFRQQVLQRAGFQCQWVDQTTGIRCARRHPDHPLEAHHCRPGNDDPVTGLALCKAEHHKAVDRNAR